MPIVENHSDQKTSWVTWRAPCKVNLFLYITGKQPNGYHDLYSLMLPLDLCDDLKISLDRTQNADTISLRVTDNPLGDVKKNLVYRAAEIFYREMAGNKNPLHIELTKNVPIAAGLGGGSSDAAATLLALNHLYEKPFSKSQLCAFAKTLGADVPFFILEQACLAEGIGEVLTPITLNEEISIVLVNPDFPLETAWVYRNLDVSQTAAAQDQQLTPKQQQYSGINWKTFLKNDLETVSLKKHPVLAEIKAQLLDLGAQGALMSGSGPTVFGVFSNRSQAQKAYERLAKNPYERVFVASPL